jgi:hypothetical protein
MIGAYTMICPYCGCGMKRGYMLGPEGVFWSAKGRAVFFIPHPAKGDIVVAGRLEGSSGENSYLCRNCGKIIIDLKHNQE